jgi:hypothetical protein
MISGCAGHALDHVRLEHAGRREAEEDVGAVDHLAERALVGVLRIDRFPAVHQRRPALIDHALDVADPDVLALEAECDQQVQAGERRRARARDDELDLADLLARQVQGVLHRGRDDDGGAMLVVVEHRDLHARLEPVLDVEAFRGLEVLQVDPAEGRLQRRDHRDHVIDLVGRRPRCRTRRCRRTS